MPEVIEDDKVIKEKVVGFKVVALEGVTEKVADVEVVADEVAAVEVGTEEFYGYKDENQEFVTEEVKESSENLGNVCADQSKAEEAFSEQNSIETNNTIEENISENTDSNVVSKGLGKSDLSSDSNSNDNDVKTEHRNENVVVIYATGIIEDSPYNHLTENERIAMLKIMSSKDHLVRNILDVHIIHISTREIRGLYNHTADIKIFVKTGNLWESPRSYLWKLIGSYT